MASVPSRSSGGAGVGVLCPVVGILQRLVWRFSGGDAAARAELAGDLGKAIQLWARAGAVDEAARVMVLRGDAEPDPKLRLQHYTQAAATATDGSAVQKTARAKKARLTVALAGGGAVSSALRQDLVLAGHELEEAGEFAEAADAYAMARDTEAEARALAKAGDVDRLEEVLGRDQAHARLGRKAHDTHAEIDALVATVQRRDALRLAERSPDDPLARSRATRLRGGRITGAVVRLTLRGQRVALVLGEEVEIGRTEGAIKVSSHALSRRHALVARREGHVVVSDLGSRNGTQLRGQELAHPLRIEDVVTLTLGGEVPLSIGPSRDLPGAVVLEIAGERFVAPLGAAKLGVGDWQLAKGADEWVELSTTAPVFAGGMTLATPVTLLRGDALSSERDAPPVVRLED
jgi:hypothetical protein